MKKKYFRLKHKIGNYFYVVLFANFILAQGESNTYFDKTIAYFKVQKNILDPFYKNIDNLSLSSFNYNQSYAGINPTNKLNKLKIETKPGANSTFVITEQFDNNDLYVPSVVDVDYRGSTGYGKKYRNSLKGNWGIFDTDDCVSVVKYLSKKSLITSWLIIASMAEDVGSMP